MTAIFISHSGRDNAAAETMKVWLTGQGHTSLFLDFDPDQGIPAGSNWKQTLYQKLRGCQAVVALGTPDWLASKWCFAEVVVAQEKGKAIFPVKVAPCDLNGLFPHIQQIDLTTNPSEGYGRLAAGLKAHGLDPDDVFAWDPSHGPPYPGLMAFEKEHAPVFFGRRDEIARARETLEQLRQPGREAPRFILFFGASGSGKSSLVRAGLIPRLEKEPSAWLPVPPFRPRQEPLAELSAALAEAFENQQRPLGREEILARLVTATAEQPADGGVLVNLARELATTARHREATVLLTVDQAEEVFSTWINDRAEDCGLTNAVSTSGPFLSLLRAAIERSDQELMVLATMRSDYLAAFQAWSALREPIYPREFAYEAVPVDPMPVDRIAEVIEGPARVADLRLGEGLVQKMVRDTGTGRALPLLAFALWRLYDQYGRDGALEVEQYSTLGGIQGVIRKEAEQIVKYASKQDLDALRAAFVPGMVGSNPEGGHVRRPALWNELPQPALPLLGHFVRSRLLVKDLDQKGREIVEVTHEALFSAWPRLAKWLDEDGDKLRLFDGLDRAAQDWDQTGRRNELLVHQGTRLRDVRELTATVRFALKDPVAQAYQNACAEKEHLQRRRKRRIVGTLAALVICIVVTGFVGVNQWGDARVQAALNLATQSKRSADEGDPKKEMLKTALEAVDALPWFRNDPANYPEAAEAAGALVRAVLLTHDSQPLGKTELVGDVAYMAHFGPRTENGDQRLAIAFRHGASIWDVRTGAQLSRLKGHEDDVSWSEFSPDGKRVVTASNDRTARVWDAVSGEQLLVLRGHEDWVNTASFSPNGERIVTASHDGTARIWDAASGKQLLKLRGHRMEDGRPAEVWQAMFSPDGQRVVTASRDNKAWIWDASSGQEELALVGHTYWVRSAEFSPNGQRVVTAGEDGQVRIWDANSGRPVRAFAGHDGAVRSAAFDLSGRLVVTASVDGTARVWDVGQLDGAWDDHTMRFWRDRGPELARFEYRDESNKPVEIRSAAFSPDGQRIVTVSADGAVRLWWCRSFQKLEDLLKFSRTRTS